MKEILSFTHDINGVQVKQRMGHKPGTNPIIPPKRKQLHRRKATTTKPISD